MNETIALKVYNFVSVSERILLLEIGASPTNLSIVQVYAPTEDKSEEDIEEFYETLGAIMKNIRKPI